MTPPDKTIRSSDKRIPKPRCHVEGCTRPLGHKGQHGHRGQNGGWRKVER